MVPSMFPATHSTTAPPPGNGPTRSARQSLPLFVGKRPSHSPSVAWLATRLRNLLRQGSSRANSVSASDTAISFLAVWCCAIVSPDWPILSPCITENTRAGYGSDGPADGRQYPFSFSSSMRRSAPRARCCRALTAPTDLPNVWATVSLSIPSLNFSRMTWR
jgi:hypothetical protein